MDYGQKTDGSGTAPLPVSADGKTIPVSGTLTATVDESTLATSAKQDTGNTSLASIDGKVGASAAPADGKTNASAASGFVQTFLSVFNGTTWDRLKSAIVAKTATFDSL